MCQSQAHSMILLLCTNRAQSGLSVDTFLLRVCGPHHLNFQGPQVKFQGSLHWNTLPMAILQFLGVHWALRQNFTRAPLDFQGPRALNSGPPLPNFYLCLSKVLANWRLCYHGYCSTLCTSNVSSHWLRQFWVTDRKQTLGSTSLTV